MEHLYVMGMVAATPTLLDLTMIYNLDPPASHKVKVLENEMNRIYIDVQLQQTCSSDHAGTHLQAPNFFKGYGWSVDSLPYERLWRVPGVKIDVSYLYDSSYEITAEVLQDFENRGWLNIPDGGVLLIYTGQAQLTDTLSEDEQMHVSQPRLTVDAAQWLANYSERYEHQKGIFGVGIDVKSLDENEKNATVSARATLFEHDIYAIHNLKNLQELPRCGFLVTVLPMRISEGVGAPARVLAEEDDTRRRNCDDDSSEDGGWTGDWNSESDHGGYDPKIYGVPGIIMSSAGAIRLNNSAWTLMLVSFFVLLQQSFNKRL